MGYFIFQLYQSLEEYHQDRLNRALICNTFFHSTFGMFLCRKNFVRFESAMKLVHVYLCVFGTAMKTGTETLPNGYSKLHATSRLLSKEVCRIPTANSVPAVLCELFGIMECIAPKDSQFPYFFYVFYLVATFLWISLCDNKFELCVANLETLWLCHRLYSFPFASALQPFISPEESHKFST